MIYPPSGVAEASILLFTAPILSKAAAAKRGVPSASNMECQATLRPAVVCSKATTNRPSLSVATVGLDKFAPLFTTIPSPESNDVPDALNLLKLIESNASLHTITKPPSASADISGVIENDETFSAGVSSTIVLRISSTILNRTSPLCPCQEITILPLINLVALTGLLVKTTLSEIWTSDICNDPDESYFFANKRSLEGTPKSLYKKIVPVFVATADGAT